YLLLGIGNRPDDPGRADVIMVVSINPDKEEILTFNIPRDTKTEISGKNSYDKINHAYSYGGTKMTKETVEDFIDSDIDDVVQINMQGFRDLRSEEHTSELQSRFDLVCRLLLEKKK